MPECNGLFADNGFETLDYRFSAENLLVRAFSTAPHSVNNVSSRNDIIALLTF